MKKQSKIQKIVNKEIVLKDKEKAILAIIRSNMVQILRILFLKLLSLQLTRITYISKGLLIT